MTMTEEDIRPSALSFIILFLASCFCIYAFVIQLAPDTMSEGIKHDLGIQAKGLGIITGCYFIAYALMQIPGGLLFDRLSPRYIIAGAIGCCALGSLIFAYTDMFWFAALGRLMMGAGSAFAFMGGLVLVARWFPARHFATYAGIIQLMSSAGAVIGERPLAKLTLAHGWRQASMGIAIVGFLLMGLVFLTLREKNPERDASQVKESVWQELKNLVKRRQIRLIAIYAFTSWTPLLVFTEMSGRNFLASAHGLAPEEAIFACSMIWIGVAIFSPILGWLSDEIKSRLWPLGLCALVNLATISAVIYMPHLSVAMIYGLLLVYGFATGAQSLSFAVVKDNVPAHETGTAIGFNNMAVVVGGALIVPLVGWLLEHNWQGASLLGVHVYSVENYRSALMILPLCHIIGLILCLRGIKETRCVNVTEV